MTTSYCKRSSYQTLVLSRIVQDGRSSWSMISTIKSVPDEKHLYLLEVIVGFKPPSTDTFWGTNNEDKATVWQHLLSLDQSSCQCRGGLTHAAFIAK